MVTWEAMFETFCRKSFPSSWKKENKTVEAMWRSGGGVERHSPLTRTVEVNRPWIACVCMCVSGTYSHKFMSSRAKKPSRLFPVNTSWPHPSLLSSVPGAQGSRRAASSTNVDEMEMDVHQPLNLNPWVGMCRSTQGRDRC